MISKFTPEITKVLVFDVDGTVTRNTLDLKVKAWETLFTNDLEKLQEAREVYEFTGKGDRYNMIAHILDVPQEGCTENAEVLQYAEKFEQLCQTAIRENGIHDDDLVALLKIKATFDGPIYLLSATPETSVVGNIEYFETIYPELVGMFAEIIGTPMSDGKAGELKRIAADLNLQNNQVVMIGDGGSDYTGAKQSQSQFIGIVPNLTKDKWPQESFPKVSAIAEVPRLLNL